MARRRGFTLVEMMVAMALTIFIMAIMAQAFVTGLETFRQLKGIGDMQENLRTAAMRLRSDLSADHFEAGRKLSDANFLLMGPPQQGFLYIQQGAASFWEGNDPDGQPANQPNPLSSFRATNHVLYFSIRLRGNHREGFLSASVPAGSPLLDPRVSTALGNLPADARFQDVSSTYSSAWGEVAYFLAPQGNTVEPNNANSTQAGTPLFVLYRVQKVVALDPSQVNSGQPAVAGLTMPIPAAQLAVYSEMSCEVDPNNNANLIFNSPSDLAGVFNNPTGVPANGTPRRSLSSFVPGPGASPLLGNVISFQVQVLSPGSPAFGDLPNPNNANPLPPFDTAVPPNPPYQINAVAITLRVWDPATQQTRQATIIQDM
jgi:prepilin-type N-terminal cleavage/methylation domain-containing protein